MIHTVPAHKHEQRQQLASAVEVFLSEGGQVDKRPIRIGQPIPGDFNNRRAEAAIPAPRHSPPIRHIGEWRDIKKAIKGKSAACREKRAELAAEVRRLAGTVSANEIAARIGVSVKTVRKIAAERGIDLGDWRIRISATDEQLQILREYAEAGATLTDALKWIGGVHRDTAKYWCARNGIEFGRKAK